MKLLFFTLLAVATNNLVAQTVNFSGQQVSQSELCNSLGFQDNAEAKNALDKICAAAELVNNYILMPCPNVGTCLALVRDDVPMIVYDNKFLEKIKTYGFSEKKISNNTSLVDWNSLTILAHELGHHVNQHFSKLRSSADFILKNEIEADEFAGATLYKLGATIDQVKESYASLPEEATFSHPARLSRLQAVEKGYSNALAKYNLNANRFNASYLIGDWKLERDVVVSFNSNGTFESSSKGKLKKGFWNIANGKINIKSSATDVGESVEIRELTNYTFSHNEGKKYVTYIRSTETARSNYDRYYEDNWSKYASVGNPTFAYRRAGGIWDLNVPLTNNSDREIEYAQVEVQYIKDKVLSSGGVYKTAYIEFRNVKARSTQKVKAPDSDRGVDVKASIISVRFKKQP